MLLVANDALAEDARGRAIEVLCTIVHVEHSIAITSPRRPIYELGHAWIGAVDDVGDALVKSM